MIFSWMLVIDRHSFNALSIRQDHRFFEELRERDIEVIVVKLLEKDPNDRYQSANETLEALPDSSDMEALVEEVIKRTTSAI